VVALHGPVGVGVGNTRRDVLQALGLAGQEEVPADELGAVVGDDLGRRPRRAIEGGAEDQGHGLTRELPAEVPGHDIAVVGVDDGLPEPGPESPVAAIRGQYLPRGRRVVARPILGGLHHESGLEKLAA
jgi:hypothetical protein